MTARMADAADRLLAGRERHDGVGLVERGEALGVAGVRALDEEPREVLGGLCLLT